MADYALEGPKWQTGQAVTYSFASTLGATFSDLLTGTYENVVRDALAAWAKVAAITFVETADGTTTDIRIGWGRLPTGVLGQTDVESAPGRPTQMATGITVALEDPAYDPVAATDTATYGDGYGVTLLQVATHEIGHALGLDHSTQPTAVMYAVATTSNQQLSSYDVAGIQALYGKNLEYTPPPPSSTTTYSPPTTTSTTIAAAPQAPPTAATAPPRTPVVIAITPDTVYRFFDTTTGTQFLSADGAEVNAVANTRPDLTFEGAAMRDVEPDAADPNVAPAYRFFSKIDGTHFLTIDKGEAASIAATRPDLVAETPTFSEHVAAEAGDTPVYRFFDTGHGTHFYTDDASERASVLATRPDLVPEGIAFYAPSLR